MPVVGSRAITSIQPHIHASRSRSQVRMYATSKPMSEAVSTDQEATIQINDRDKQGSVIEEFQDKEFAGGFKKAPGAGQSLDVMAGQ